SRPSIWACLWRKVMNYKAKATCKCDFDDDGRERLGGSSRFSYDIDSYSLNFDQGSAMPENLSRSFSARFAVPYRV
ncbi:hypothetical protein M569_17430, partial [Genlisea aurea]